MEYNAFTEGVRPGSVTTSHEVMILICYLIDQAGQPVSFQELNAALHRLRKLEVVYQLLPLKSGV